MFLRRAPGFVWSARCTGPVSSTFTQQGILLMAFQLWCICHPRGCRHWSPRCQCALLKGSFSSVCFGWVGLCFLINWRAEPARFYKMDIFNLCWLLTGGISFKCLGLLTRWMDTGNRSSDHRKRSMWRTRLKSLQFHGNQCNTCLAKQSMSLFTCIVNSH